MEGLIFGILWYYILPYPENFTALLRTGLSDKRFYGSGTISYKIDLIINMTL